MPHQTQQPTANLPTRVWDLPTRVFHWALVLCMIGAFVTIKIGGNALVWHARFGYAILVLIAFRIIWGFIGGRYARFNSFWPNPLRAIDYLKGKVQHHAGHNPLGAFSVYALIGAIGAQAVGGLFANDDIAFDGPLVKYISRETSNFITTLHKWNEKVLIALVVLHVLAICYYVFIKKERLVRPMISGDHPTAQAPHSQDDAKLRMTALVVVLILSAVVWWVVR